MGEHERESRAPDFLIRRFGALPPREAKLRAVRALHNAQLRATEPIEIGRTRRQLRRPARATTVTVIATIGRPHLPLSVRSALDQTVTDHHVVVVSDGAGLPELPSDPRLSVVAMRRRHGSASLARDIGIGISESRYLAFLDDDNTWAPDHLERLLPALEEGADLAYSTIRWVDEHDVVLREMIIPFDRVRLREESYIDTNAIVVRRNRQARFRCVERRRGDATAEDWELVWRVSRRGRVVHVAGGVANLRVHGGSTFSPPVVGRAGLDLQASV
jgi:glycosyltransferase involved in cell wall biosynthesis